MTKHGESWLARSPPSLRRHSSASVAGAPCQQPSFALTGLLRLPAPRLSADYMLYVSQQIPNETVLSPRKVAKTLFRAVRHNDIPYAHAAAATALFAWR